MNIIIKLSIYFDFICDLSYETKLIIISKTSGSKLITVTSFQSQQSNQKVGTSAAFSDLILPTLNTFHKHRRKVH